MATQPRELPNKARWTIEDSREFLSQVRKAVRTAQEENLKGNQMGVAIHLGDIREAAVMIDELLAGMYRGDYSR